MRSRLKLDQYRIVEQALERGLQFALNRLEDHTSMSIPEDLRAAALEPMLNELMIALDEVVAWEDPC